MTKGEKHMSVQELYASKLTTPAEAVRHVQDGDTVVVPRTSIAVDDQSNRRMVALAPAMA